MDTGTMNFRDAVINPFHTIITQIQYHQILCVRDKDEHPLRELTVKCRYDSTKQLAFPELCLLIYCIANFPALLEKRIPFSLCV